MRWSLQSCVAVVFFCLSLSAPVAVGPAKVQVISFGKWIPAQRIAHDEDKPLPIKVRGLIVDGRVKQYSLGPVHAVTERLFVVRRGVPGQR